MVVSPRGSTDVHREVRGRLAGRSIRYTGGRQALIGELQKVNGPQSAADLHNEIESVPLSSLYRSLVVLEEAGVLARHHDADGIARFELAEWLTGHHHHVVCLDCGAVEDVELDKSAESTLDELAAALAAAAGYQLGGHELEVEGLCPSCRP